MSLILLNLNFLAIQCCNKNQFMMYINHRLQKIYAVFSIWIKLYMYLFRDCFSVSEAPSYHRDKNAVSAQMNFHLRCSSSLVTIFDKVLFAWLEKQASTVSRHPEKQIGSVFLTLKSKPFCFLSNSYFLTQTVTHHIGMENIGLDACCLELL